MRCMVTGGAGYIGSHLVLELLALGHDVVILDDLSSGFYEAVHRVERLSGKQVAFVHADVADGRRVRDALRDVDMVFHLAALKVVAESMQLPALYFRNNLGGMAALLEAMEDTGVRRIVYSSTAAVYDAAAPMPLAESAAVKPSSPYGLSKAHGEGLLDWMASQRAWSAVSLRYFNPVGAHPSGRIGEPIANASSLVPRVLTSITGHRDALTVFGTDYDTPDGTALRDYIHVMDLAQAHLACMPLLDQAGHGVFNVGTGRGRSVREVIDSAQRVTGQTVPAVDGERRAGDLPVAIADPGRFRAATGFSADRDLDDMVSSAWSWWQSCPQGYDG